MRMLIATGALAMLAACTPATMRGLDAIAASTDTVAVRGIGIGRGGGFRLDDGRTGRFRRDLATRAQGALDDRPVGLVARTGAVSFTLDGGPGGAAPLAGECRFGTLEGRTLFGNAGLSVEDRATLVPFGFGCRFTRGGVAVGGLGLGETPPRGRALAERRAGELVVDGRHWRIVSEHAVAEAPGFEGAVPVGYRFEDEDGRAVGAVSRIDGPRILVPRDPAGREAALMAGLALALFWDPAND